MIGAVATIVSAAYYLAVVRAMFLRDSVGAAPRPRGRLAAARVVLGAGVAIGGRRDGRLVLLRPAARRRRASGSERLAAVATTRSSRAPRLAGPAAAGAGRPLRARWSRLTGENEPGRRQYGTS